MIDTIFTNGDVISPVCIQRIGIEVIQFLVSVALVTSRLLVFVLYGYDKVWERLIFLLFSLLGKVNCKIVQLNKSLGKSRPPLITIPLGNVVGLFIKFATLLLVGTGIRAIIILRQAGPVGLLCTWILHQQNVSLWVGTDRPALVFAKLRMSFVNQNNGISFLLSCPYFVLVSTSDSVCTTANVPAEACVLKQYRLGKTG